MEENKIKKKQKKEKDKNDSLGDYSISSEEEEKKEEQNKNIQSQENDNLNSYFSSSNKKTNYITPPINNEKRLQTHIEGKLHSGYLKIRQELDILRKRKLERKRKMEEEKQKEKLEKELFEHLMMYFFFLNYLFV